MLSLLVGVIVTTTVYINGEMGKVSNAVPNYKEKFIRFHVLANSDSEEDQNLKLKVRDEIIAYLQPMLKESSSIEESEKIILDKSDELEKIGKDIIKENGYDYDVKVELGYSNFPTKQYSNIVLPAGEYKALRILIGEAEGKNWWCVMFPPLCFVDENNGVIDEETEEGFKKLLTEEEYNLIVEDSKDNANKLQVKFKILELFEKLKGDNANLKFKLAKS